MIPCAFLYVWYLHGNGRRRSEVGLRLELLSSQGKGLRRGWLPLCGETTVTKHSFGQDESLRNTRFKEYILPLYHGGACDLPAHLTSGSYCSRRLQSVGVPHEALSSHQSAYCISSHRHWLCDSIQWVAGKPCPQRWLVVRQAGCSAG